MQMYKALYAPCRFILLTIKDKVILLCSYVLVPLAVFLVCAGPSFRLFIS